MPEEEEAEEEEEEEEEEEDIWEHNNKAGILEKVADDEIPRITEY